MNDNIHKLPILCIAESPLHCISDYIRHNQPTSAKWLMPQKIVYGGYIDILLALIMHLHMMVTHLSNTFPVQLSIYCYLQHLGLGIECDAAILAKEFQVDGDVL